MRFLVCSFITRRITPNKLFDGSYRKFPTSLRISKIQPIAGVITGLPKDIASIAEPDVRISLKGNTTTSEAFMYI